ncbi:hypothetical protein AAC387_Pa06g3184 [Persea americana]
MEFLKEDEEPFLPDLKELKMRNMPELLALCKGILSLDALKSLESLKVFFCHKLKYLLPARLLQQPRSLKHINVRSCNGMEKIAAEEEEMEEGRNDDKSTMTMTLSSATDFKDDCITKAEEYLLKGINLQCFGDHL